MPVRAAQPGSVVQRIAGSAGFEGFESLDGSAVFCAEGGKLWSVPLNGGAPSLVIGKGVWDGWWSFAPGGIIYGDVTRQKKGLPGDLPVLFYSFRTHRSTVLTNMPQRVFDSDPGLTVSPDGRYLVLARIEEASTNLVLVSVKR